MKATLVISALLAGILLSEASLATESASNNTNLVKVSGYCIGENMVRTKNLTDLIKTNGQQVKDVQGKTDLDAETRQSQAGGLGHVGAIMVFKSMALSMQMQWWYKMLLAIKDGDTRLLNTSMDEGKKEGEIVAKAESQCYAACANSQGVDDARVCMDSCLLHETSTPFKMTAECDRLYTAVKK